jgi:hypothetical protein
VFNRSARIEADFQAFAVQAGRENPLREMAELGLDATAGLVRSAAHDEALIENLQPGMPGHVV